MADPLAEISRRWSPYNYVENSPIRNIDLDGMETVGGGNFILEGEAAQNYFQQLQAQQGGEGERKDKHKNKDKDEESSSNSKRKNKPAPWKYNVPVWGDSLRAQDDWDAGNYWSYTGDMISGVTTGVFLFEATAEDGFVSAYKSVTGLFVRKLSIKSVDGLIEAAGELTATRAGALQGTIKGADVEKVFETLAKGGKKLASGAVEFPNGTTIYRYTRTSTSEPSIFINTSKQLYKITILK